MMNTKAKLRSKYSENFNEEVHNFIKKKLPIVKIHVQNAILWNIFGTSTYDSKHLNVAELYSVYPLNKSFCLAHV